MTDTQSQIVYQEAIVNDLLTGVIVDSPERRYISLLNPDTGDVKLALDVEMFSAALPIIARLVNIAAQVPRVVFPEPENNEPVFLTPEQEAEIERRVAERLEIERRDQEKVDRIISLDPNETPRDGDPGPGADGWG